MRDIPKPGQIYRHFKGNLYQIVTIARHSETLEALVIYQALYGDYQVYARPLHMFMSELDREKYSDVKQRERFELIRTANEITADEMNGQPEYTEYAEQAGLAEETYLKQPEEAIRACAEQVGTAAVEQSKVNETGETVQEQAAVKLDAGVEEFLDAGSFEERLRIFTGMQHRLTEEMINIMAVSMDTEVAEETLEGKIASLKNYLLMQVKYECGRVR